METSSFELIVPSRIGEFTPPWTELLAGAPHRLLPAQPVRFDWERRLDELAGKRGLSRDVGFDLVMQNRKLGVEESLLAKAAQVFSGSGGVVITGQQPGLFGGPLYTLYKVITTVELARHLEERYAIPVVPVLWNAGDDDDFNEVRSCTIGFPDSDLITVAANLKENDNRRCVGDISIERLRSALGRIKPLLQTRGARGESISRMLEDTLEGGRWGDHFSRLYTSIFPGSLLVYDARSDVWRAEAAPLLERTAVHRERLLKELEGRAELMRSIGITPPIHPRTLEIPFTYIDDGIKRKFPEWNGARIGRILEEEPSSLYPNVTLRAPIQDALFPVIAVIIGPGETGYLMQLSPVYEALGVTEPIRVPRLTATLIPPRYRSVGEKIGVERSTLFLEWDRCIREYIETELPDGFSGRFDELSWLVEERGRELAGLFGGNAGFERELEKVVAAVRKLRSAGTGALLGELRAEGFRPDALARFVRPRGLLQERVLSPLVPLAAGLAVSPGGLGELANLHIERLGSSGSGHYLVDLPVSG